MNTKTVPMRSRPGRRVVVAASLLALGACWMSAEGGGFSDEFDKPISRSSAPRDSFTEEAPATPGAPVVTSDASPSKAAQADQERDCEDVSRQLETCEARYQHLKSEHDRLVQWSRDERTVRSGKALREQLGDVDNIALVGSLNDVGLLMMAEGRWDTAEELFRRALVMLDHINGRTGASSGTMLQHLGDVAWRKNDLVGAASFYREAGEVFAASVGTSSPRYAAILNSRAGVLRAQGNPGEAESLYREALGIYEQRANRKIPDAAVVRHNLGLLLMEQGMLEEAGPLLERAVEQLQDHRRERMNTLIALRTLARWHQLAGHPEKAAACEERVTEMAMDVLVE